MRPLLLIAALLTTAPHGVPAQLARADTAALTTTLARTLLTWYAKPGDFRGPTVIQLKAATPNAWESGLANALRTLDSAAITATPSRLTLRTVVNVVHVARDSAVFRIAFNRCTDSGRYGAFGNLVDFTFVRREAGWAPVAEARSGHGDGPCRWPRDSVSTPDSSAIAAAIARALSPRIKAEAFGGRAVMDERPTSPVLSAPWNRLVGLALHTLDSALIATPPTTYTTRVNIMSVGELADSLAVRVAFATCRDTPRGLMSGATGVDYTFHQVNGAWVLRSGQIRGHGDGRCAR